MQAVMKKATVRRLNVGCGAFKKDGYLNIDISPELNPDVAHDLNLFPYPFESNQFQLIEASHVLEHLENPFRVMCELHRILEDGGKLIVRVPHFTRGFTHPEHKRGFDVTFPYYFNPTFQGGYTRANFLLERLRLTWFSQPYLKETVLSKPTYLVASTMGKLIDVLANMSPEICSRSWCFLVGGFEEIEFDFVCKK